MVSSSSSSSIPPSRETPSGAIISRTERFLQLPKIKARDFNPSPATISPSPLPAPPTSPAPPPLTLPSLLISLSPKRPFFLPPPPLCPPSTLNNSSPPTTTSKTLTNPPIPAFLPTVLASFSTRLIGLPKLPRQESTPRWIRK